MADKDKDKIPDALIRGKTPEEILGQNGILKQLTKQLVERALEAELTEHLGYEKHAPEGRNSGNSRNGKTSKAVVTGTREIELEVRRDRKGGVRTADRSQGPPLRGDPTRPISFRAIFERRELRCDDGY